MDIHIPEQLASELKKKALATGIAPEQVAIYAIRRSLKSEQELSELLTPVREAFRQSGLSEDEAVELFESEKHAHRREEKRGDRK